MSTLARPDLRLPAELTIFTASETRSAWVAWLAEEQQLGDADSVCRVEAADVAEVDAAGVQLLVSLCNSLSRQHRQLQLCQPSDVLRKACASLGVATLLLQDQARTEDMP